MNDRDFVAAFEACAIAKADFRHADHVRLAWIYLSEHPLIEAIERFTAALQRFAAHNGVPGLYHETITWAYVLLVAERREGGAGEDWPAFASRNPDLLAWRPSLLETRYYRLETLWSDRARSVFVMPDRVP